MLSSTKYIPRVGTAPLDTEFRKNRTKMRISYRDLEISHDFRLAKYLLERVKGMFALGLAYGTIEFLLSYNACRFSTIYLKLEGF